MEDIKWAYNGANVEKKRNDNYSKVNHLPSKVSYENKMPTFDTNYSKYRSFNSYLKRILKTSLITSFPEIAASKSWVTKTIKIIVFILCVIGFTYQTLGFLWLYLDYPTVTNVYISNPYEIVQPAITICNVNRKRRSFVCSAPYYRCSKMESETFCIKHSRFCPGNNPKRAFPEVVLVNYLNDVEFDWDITYLESHNESMINRCKMKLDQKNWSCNKNYTRIPVVDTKGEPNCCFTIESLAGQPEAEDKLYPNNLVIDLYLRTQGEEYSIPTDPAMIQIKIHDRRAAVNPFADGFRLEGGSQYTAYVSMETQELLPPPYDTNCMDYLEMWRENNGTGPLNRLMCVEQCRLNKLLEMDKCIDRNVNYPHTFQLCDIDVYSLTSEIMKNCTLKCRSSCYDERYDVQYVKAGNTRISCMDEDVWCKEQYIQLSIIFNKLRLTRYVYQPKFESVELFSYVGGYMGMWLGLSLVSLFDFFEMISYLFFYPVGLMAAKWKTRSVKPRPVKNPFLGTLY